MEIEKARKVSELYKKVLDIDEKIYKLEQFNELYVHRSELTWVNNDGAIGCIRTDEQWDVTAIRDSMSKCYITKREELIDMINKL